MRHGFRRARGYNLGGWGRTPARPLRRARRAGARILTYVTADARRMDYPRYRRHRLPVSRAAAELLTKQFSQRGKRREKFWVRRRAEAVP